MTAIEQLMIDLYEKGHLRGDGSKLDRLLEKYKEIEKQQMFGFTDHYHVIGEGTEKFFKEAFEQYYKETYNK